MSKEMTDSYSIFDIMEGQEIPLEDFQDLVSVYTYQIPELTNETVTGQSHGEEDYYGSLFDQTPVEVMKVGDYNKAARAYHMPEYELDQDEYLIVANQEGAVGDRKSVVQGTRWEERWALRPETTCTQR